MIQAIAAVLMIITATPEPNAETFINDNKITITFNQQIIDHNITVTDGEGCVISQNEEVVSYNQIAVNLKACKVMGFPAGMMLVQYKVNGSTGEYHIHIRSHHGM